MRWIWLILFAIASNTSAEPPNTWADIADGMLPSFYDGNKLLNNAEEAPVWATAYVAGVYDSLKTGRYICIRPSITTGQMRDVAIKYVKENPKLRDGQAHMLVRDALINAFPCPAPK